MIAALARAALPYLGLAGFFAGLVLLLRQHLARREVRKVWRQYERETQAQAQARVQEQRLIATDSRHRERS